MADQAENSDDYSSQEELFVRLPVLPILTKMQVEFTWYTDAVWDDSLLLDPKLLESAARCIRGTFPVSRCPKLASIHLTSGPDRHYDLSVQPSSGLSAQNFPNYAHD